MELSEAKKECKKIIENYLSSSMIIKNEEPIPPVRIEFTDRQSEAIDTVLKALHENELIIDRIKNIKDRLAYDITYNWDNALDDLRRMLGV